MVARTIVRSLTHRLSPARYGTHVLGLASGRDLIRRILIGTLRGEDRHALTESAHAYVTTELSTQGIAYSQRVLAEHQARGDRIVLMSNSIEPVIAAIAGTLGIEHVASTLGYDGEMCTGRIAEELTGTKHLALARLLDEYESRPVVSVVTDNASDRKLLDAADERTVIWQGRRPHAAFARLEAAYVHVEG